MKIGILQCDNVPEPLFEKHDNYPVMLKSLLHSIDQEITFNCYQVMAEQLPLDVDECDAYITTGSRHSVNDDFVWIYKLESFICELHKRNIKLFGICFGHQMIAKCLGGNVARSKKGWGIGVKHNAIVRKKHWMDPPKKSVKLLASHSEQVDELPADAEILASSEFCPNYMIQAGSLIGVQGHPEFSKSYSSDLMALRKDRIPAETIREGIVSLEEDVDSELLGRWIVNFLVS